MSRQIWRPGMCVSVLMSVIARDSLAGNGRVSVGECHCAGSLAGNDCVSVRVNVIARGSLAGNVRVSVRECHCVDSLAGNGRVSVGESHCAGQPLAGNGRVSIREVMCMCLRRTRKLNWSGIIIGVFAFVITGVFHPVVVKCEYYFSAKVWPLFLVAGLLCAGISLFAGNDTVSGVFGILAFVLLWCIRELHEQEERVRKGWFPRNPNRQVPQA